MKDISELLINTIEKEQCTALTAFLRVREEKNNAVCILQSKPTEQASRRLRDTSNRKTDR